MKQHIAYALIALTGCLVAAACTQNRGRQEKIRLFTPKDTSLKVITYSINDKNHTMLLLYGNAAALAHSTNPTGAHTAGELFTLVTFAQQNNDYWFGSQINGAVQQIETVMATQQHNQLAWTYSREATASTAPHVDTAARVQYMLNQRGAFFP